MTIRLAATRMLKRLQPSETNLLVIMAVLVGLVTGFGAIAVARLIEYFNGVCFGLTDQMLATAAGFANWQGFKWWYPIIPTLGGLLVGLIVYRFAREAKGHGVPEVMNAVARLGGIIRPRAAAAKTIASAICIGTGGSAGREGPIVQIGSAFGSTIGQIFRMSGDRVKILVGCGAAAGISAVFNAPIAGVVFSLEVILGDYAIRTFAPVILSSVVASMVTRTFLGNHPAFDIPSYSLVSAWEIPMYVAMGAALGVVAVAFVKALDSTETFFDKLKINNMLKPALGGLLLGLLVLFFPQVLADGFKTIHLTLSGNLAIWLMVVLIVAKIVATSLTLGSGSSGGIFAPSLFMGAVAGGSFGVLVNKLFPTATANPGAYALVGMAGLVAGVTHAPITALLIVFEMTSDYHIILPLIVTVVFSVLVSRKLFQHSVFTVKLAKQGIVLRDGRDVNVLKSHLVSEIMDTRFETIPASTTLLDIFHTIEHSHESHFVVVDSNGDMKGMLSFQDIRNLLSKRTLDYLVIAQDLIAPDPVVLTAGDDLEKAHSLFGHQGYQLIPVVEYEGSRTVVGVVRRDNLIDYYNKRLIDQLRQ
jgi:CIC family chloride channel protein